MGKRVSLLVLALILLVAGSVGAVEARLIAGDILTRGEYAALLVEAAGIEGEGEAVDLLVDKGIMQGYSDGNMHLEEGISRVEAVVLAAKALGLEAYIAPPAGVETPLKAEHWGHNLYSHFVYLGLVEGDPHLILSPEEGAAFLHRVFAPEPKAQELMERAQAAQKEMEGALLRTAMKGGFSLILREGAEDLAPLPAAVEMTITQELLPPHKLHQVTSIALDMPELGREEMTSETYLLDGKMYMGTTDPETGQLQWFRFPAALLPDLEGLLEQAQRLEALPAGLEKYMHYHLLGTTELDGEEVYVISFYGLIDDYASFLNVALGQLGGMGDIGQALAPMTELIDSVSYWGVQYLNVDDLLVRGGDFNGLVVFAADFLTEAVPLEAMFVHMEIEEFTFASAATFEVPEEVLAAPELEFPAMEDLSPKEPAA